MTEISRDSQVTYRTSVERHKRLKTAAVERDEQVQEILDNAVDAYLGAPPQQRIKVDSKRSNLHLSLDSLLDNAHAAGPGWQHIAEWVEQTLNTWRKNHK